MGNVISEIIGSVVSGCIVGLFVWRLSQSAIEKKYKTDAIRDLMSCRGDVNSIDFRRALNRISITFHYDEEIRIDVRRLYELLNSENTPGQKIIDRAIVGLIFKLCGKNGFDGLTEYDIDQSFAETLQTPQELGSGNN
ncbi:hypothetical protein H6770_04295 [Candidatus Peribacteria bacterium]|nr:hypothetical protein [Candidatus Peribacteria bacterium]